MTERIIHYTFETASNLGKTWTSISKANALNYSMIFWVQVFEEIIQKYPHVEIASYLVDAAALLIIKGLARFEAVITFEPIHGSATNIAGQHMANPLATV